MAVGKGELDPGYASLHPGYGPWTHPRRVFASSWKKLLSSAFGIVPARPSNRPSPAISRTALVTAVHATRASVPPKLMRRTPRSARSFTLKFVADDIRKFTGF